MAVLAKKVVRLEDVSPDQDDRHESLLGDMSVDNNNSRKGSIVNTAFTGATSELMAVMSDSLTPVTESEQVDSVSLQSEAQDQVMPLPDGWPRLDKLKEKHSWDYTTIEPSIQKATSHLELLQTIIEEWFNDYRSRSHSKTSSNKAQQQAGGRRPMHFQASTPSSTSELTVLGHGGKGDDVMKQTTLVAPSPQDNVPYLGAEDVVEEVTLLLAKMETSRKDHLEALYRERNRSEMLKVKIDNISIQRMEDLPLAVQREHEACAMDINELNWHVAYRSRIEQRNKNKAQVAEALNGRLKEDIEFVNGHIPLVKEKLELEVDAMDRIKVAQVDADEELDTTMQRFRKVDSKSSEAHGKAEQERSAIKKDLDTVRDDLQKITTELEEARKLHESYIHQCNDNRQRFSDNKQEIKVQLVRDENMKAAEAMQFAKVQELEIQIKRKEYEHKTLEDSNLTIMAKIDANALAFSKAEKEMRDSIAEREEVLRQLNRQNDELKMDTEDLNRKITDCDRQKAADEKNLERMKKEFDKTEEQTNMTREDLGNISIINNAIREKLRNDEERCLQAEEALRSTAEGLKKQVKEEIHTRTMLTARINSDSTELIDIQAEVKVKREMIDRKATEVEMAVANVLKKVEKLRTFHRDKTRMIADMKDELTNIADTKRDIDQTCNQKMQELTPPHTELKNKLQVEMKKLDHINWKTDMMNKNIKEMDESGGMMQKAMDKTNKAIATLQADLEELNKQLDTGQKIENRLNTDLTQCNSRLEALGKIHTDHMAERHKVLGEHEASLVENKAMNTVFAARYRSLQNQHVELKKKMLNRFEERVRLECAVKDLKQLQCLQMRMHSAMLEYFRYRGMYNKGELECMEEQSHDNAIKVGNLQDQMDGALEKISFFLTNQLDGDSIRKLAMDRVKEKESREPTQLTMPANKLNTKPVIKPILKQANKPITMSGVAVS